MQVDKFTSGKLSMFTANSMKTGSSGDSYAVAMVLDSSKHASFGILVNNSHQTNGLYALVEVSNAQDPMDSNAVWAKYQDEVLVSAGTSQTISGVSVSTAIRVSIKNSANGSNSSYKVFGRLNPMAIF